MPVPQVAPLNELNVPEESDSVSFLDEICNSSHEWVFFFLSKRYLIECN